MKKLRSYPDFIDKLIKVLNKHKVEYMIIGGASAIIQGFNSVTQDIDLYPKKSLENSEKIINSLLELDFKLTDKDKQDILRGKDFIQFNEPYELDLAFFPDGFENYEEAKKFKIQIKEFPLLSLEGIIKSKQAANRPKDRAVLDLLKDFLKFKKEKKEYINEDYFFIPEGYKIADIQTLQRWNRNLELLIEERLYKGIAK